MFSNPVIFFKQLIFVVFASCIALITSAFTLFHSIFKGLLACPSLPGEGMALPVHKNGSLTMSLPFKGQWLPDLE